MMHRILAQPRISRLNRITRLRNLIAWYSGFLRTKSYSLNDLDKKLLSIIGKRNGFFIEAGANDGKTQSNTLLFERYRGWSGLLIEPIPELFDQCKRNRPFCKLYQAALVSRDYQQSSIKIHACGLMSTVVGSMGSAEAEANHIALGSKIQSVQPYLIEVPAKSLSDILDENGVEQVDLLSLDVEGFEAEALRGIDFDRHAPKYILVEERFPEQIAPILIPRYELVEQLSSHDKLYVLR